MMVTSLSSSLHLYKHVQYFPTLVLSEVDLLHLVKECTCLLSLYEKKIKKSQEKMEFYQLCILDPLRGNPLQDSRLETPMEGRAW